MKTFESYDWKNLKELEIGDYIMLDPTDLSLPSYESKNRQSAYEEFIQNNIGEVVNIDKVHDVVKIMFHNIPYTIEDLFDEYGIYFYPLSNIKYIGKTIEDIKLKYEADKFNL